MRVTSKFEGGNGKNIVELAPGVFRIEAVGEKAPYCKYFCVRVEGGETGGIATLAFYPDPLLGEAGRVGFIGHYPSRLWFTTNEIDWWAPITNRWPGADRFFEDHVETQVSVPAGGVVTVASNPMWTYTQALAWTAEMAAKGAESVPLEMSFEGREIPRLHIPSTGEKPLKVAVLSGQHPSEHCATFCAAGVAELLLSAHPDAETLRAACDTWVMPMCNVDGNVHGRNGWTMQNVNPHPDFLGAASGAVPAALEDQLVWRWLAEELKPDLIVHFHGFLGCRLFSDAPYDGLYVFGDPAAVYADPARRARYERLTAAMIWDTPGASAMMPVPEHDETTLDWNLALACGTLSAFYEINHGYAGVMASKQRGAHVFRTAVRAIL